MMDWGKLAASARLGVETAARHAETARALAASKLSELSTTHEHLCARCGKSESMIAAAAHIGLLKFDHCRMCSGEFCNPCLKMSSIAVYKEWWDASGPKQPASGKGLICEECGNKLLKRAIDEFVALMTAEFDETVKAFLADEGKKEWRRPEVAADSNSRKAYRAAQLVDMVIDYTPLGPITGGVMRFAFYGSQMLRMVVPEDAYVILAPVMEGMQAFGVKGPSGILRLYYLGCAHERERKMNPAEEYADRVADAQGVVHAVCPADLLDHLGAHAGIAQWMYNCQLPAPYTSNAWSCWYLSRVVAADGWALLACLNETTKLPSGKNCPAFCLAARYSPTREAVLVIRGTRTAGCWAINAQYQCSALLYQRAGGGSVQGRCHTGMRDAALAILQDYQMEAHLLQLARAGFGLKVVGHSLGAGTATVLCAELRNKLLRWVEDGELAQLPSLQGICYASPPCVTSELADAFAADELILTVINQDDFVPRLGRHTLLKLADQLKDMDKLAADWGAIDQANLTAFFSSMGQAGVTASSVLATREDGGAAELESFEREVREIGADMDAARPEPASAEWEADLLVVAGTIVNIYKKRGACLVRPSDRKSDGL